MLLKRDDLFEAAGVRGGKARACWMLAQGARQPQSFFFDVDFPQN
jgi:hypothetical protein